ncbi:hypothetical protein SEA_MABODAMACA_72 [Microbacterium phage Mabodamaca]|uniref:Uncharacterized protein n=1 Tax=Microbacterium phage Mabodamaca TaxID=3078574 RepID=A0AA96SFX0_9CAUD|nr:hypothetical protein SEA_MABODAMACA_72 [Microbacterium phage Mabodamaca]
MRGQTGAPGRSPPRHQPKGRHHGYARLHHAHLQDRRRRHAPPRQDHRRRPHRRRRRHRHGHRLPLAQEHPRGGRLPDAAGGPAPGRPPRLPGAGRRRPLHPRRAAIQAPQDRERLLRLRLAGLGPLRQWGSPGSPGLAHHLRRERRREGRLVTVAEPQEAPEPGSMASAPLDKLVASWGSTPLDPATETPEDFFARRLSARVLNSARIEGLDVRAVILSLGKHLTKAAATVGKSPYTGDDVVAWLATFETAEEPPAPV